MKTRSISDISHKGGFPRAIDDVVRTNEPLIVTIRGDSTVMISPCPPGMEKVVADSIGFGRIIATLALSGMDDDVVRYAISQFTNGLYAQAMLLELLSDEQFDQLFENGKELVKSIHATALNHGRKVMKDFEHFQKNSTQDTALSRNDNRSGVVSEVKQEELADASSSLSRKHGRPKKEVSSPLKR